LIAPQQRRRHDTPFSWKMTCGGSVYGALSGVDFNLLYCDASAIREAYTVGYPLARDMFGPDVEYDGPNSLENSYGHINCLGSALSYPPDADVGCVPIYDSLEDGIRTLREDVNWATAGEMPRYLDTWAQLRRDFPGHAVPFDRFRAQGPITTAWLLRGQDFFYDLYDDPPRWQEYLALVTASIISFRRFVCKVNGSPFPLDEVLITDDIAAMIPPPMWRESVVISHRRVFARLPCRSRAAHIEDLVQDHLPFLDEIELDWFDPRVSPRISPTDIRDQCGVPFEWHLNPMQLRDFTPAQVRAHMMAASEGGASRIVCCLARDCLASRNALRNIEVFLAVAKEVAAAMRRSGVAS
jgi:hypothetical protein